jgi:hypothetical protein
MGNLGDNLDDYYSYQLIDKVIEQIEKKDTGDLFKLNNRLNLAVKKVKNYTKGISYDKKN